MNLHVLCLVPAGSPSSGSTESAETAGALCGDEQNNGPRKKPKDLNSSKKEESTSPQSSQGAATNERTHPPGVVEGELEQNKVSGEESGAGSRETQVDDGANVREEDGSRTQVREGQESVNSSVPSHESNNFDFDLSSDSDSDSVADKPPSSESESEGKVKESKQEDVTTGLGDGEGQGDCKSDRENTCDAKDPLGVLLPDPELGNGCSDRREPETESQNSEQSGVTTGEELLDQSMEDEEEDEDEEADNDHDDHLIYLEEVLERIHAEYYTRYEAFLKKEASDTPDIRKIVPELKSKTLDGTRIVFSGLYPTNYPMERTREFYHAKALGAKIGKGLLLSPKDPSRTTHLIAARAGR